jgi:hypothetical protein
MQPSIHAQIFRGAALAGGQAARRDATAIDSTPITLFSTECLSRLSGMLSSKSV